MNNGEQVAETGRTALQLPVMFHEPAGSRKARPYKEEMLGKGVVEVAVNNNNNNLQDYLITMNKRYVYISFQLLPEAAAGLPHNTGERK